MSQENSVSITFICDSEQKADVLSEIQSLLEKDWNEIREYCSVGGDAFLDEDLSVDSFGVYTGRGNVCVVGTTLSSWRGLEDFTDALLSYVTPRTPVVAMFATEDGPGGGELFLPVSEGVSDEVSSLCSTQASHSNVGPANKIAEGFGKADELYFWGHTHDEKEMQDCRDAKFVATYFAMRYWYDVGVSFGLGPFFIDTKKTRMERWEGQPAD
jgi:hypothetical protein